MKNTFLMILGLIMISFGRISAQNPPNPSFESWTASENYILLPTSWYGTNINYLNTIKYIGVTQESNQPYDGSYYARLKSGSITVFGTTYKLPGGLTLSDLYYATGASQFKEPKIKAGVPYTGRPTRLKGFHRYTRVNNDSFYISVLLSKWNVNKRDTIGYGRIIGSANVSNWTQFEVPIEYRSSTNPDTVNIIMMSSPVFSQNDLSKVQVGSTLDVDKLEFIMVDYFDVDFVTSGNPCTGGTLTFTGTSENVPAQSWEWKVNGQAAGTGNTLTYTFPEVSVATQFAVSLKGTSASLGSDEITKNITIYPKPNITISPQDPFICPGTSVTLTASGGTSYSWNTSGSGAQITVSPKEYTLYEVTGTDAFGCVNTASSMIFYHKLDTTRTTASFCSNGSYDFYVAELTEAGVYYHNLTSVLKGCDSTIVLTLSAIPAPSAEIEASALSVCEGSQVTLSATEGYTSYDWGLGATTTSSITFTPENTQKHYLTVTASNGCSASDSILIEVNSPSLTTESFAICSGDSLEIFGNWEKASGEYTEVFSNINGCDSTVTVTLVVHELPEVFDVTGGGNYSPTQQGQPVYLSGSETGISYHLMKEGEVVATLEGTGTELDFGIQGTGDYTVWAENPETDCSVMMTGSAIVRLVVSVDVIDGQKIEVFPNPVKDFVYISVPVASDLRIISSTGQILIQIPNFTSSQINLEHLDPGLYFVEVKTKRQPTMKKILKL